ncbi:hypothetical protein QTN25_001413 [Entamoeba marina]
MFIVTNETIPTTPMTIETLRSYCNEKPKYLIEDWIDSSNNFIHWNRKSCSVNQHNYSNTLNCFSHFSLFRTSQQLVIADIHGVYNNGIYILTDPCIHHESTRFFYWDQVWGKVELKDLYKTIHVIHYVQHFNYHILTIKNMILNLRVFTK